MNGEHGDLDQIRDWIWQNSTPSARATQNWHEEQVGAANDATYCGVYDAAYSEVTRDALAESDHNVIVDATKSARMEQER